MYMYKNMYFSNNLKKFAPTEKVISLSEIVQKNAHNHDAHEKQQSYTTHTVKQ